MSLSATNQSLTILHTNDIHSHFEQMPKIASAIRSLSGMKSPDEVLTIDCGDHMDRMRLETEGSNGLINVDIMNETGYEAVVLGNNEGLTFTPDILERIYGSYAKFKVLGSNLFKASTQHIAPWMVPFQVVQKKQLRIGLIGVTANFSDFYKLLGWDVRDPFEVTKHWVKKLRPEVHILIVLSHLGLAHDQRLAQEIEGIDCILGGHTHHLLEQPLEMNGTYICAAGKFGRYVGEVELQYDLTKRRITGLTGRCVDVNGYPDAEPIVRKIAEYRQMCVEKLNRPIAMLEEPLGNDWRKESPLGNLLAAGLRSWTDTEIGLVNSGQLLQGLSAGQVTSKTLLEICPSPINPCRMLLSGAQIWQALEESLLEEFIEKPIRGFGFRGSVLGTLCLDGITVDYNPTLAPYHKIKSVRTDRGPLDKQREYRVGTIDMFTFRVGYTSLSEGRDIQFFLPEFLRDILHCQLDDPKAVNGCHVQRWHKSDRCNHFDKI